MVSGLRQTSLCKQEALSEQFPVRLSALLNGFRSTKVVSGLAAVEQCSSSVVKVDLASHHA